MKSLAPLVGLLSACAFSSVLGANSNMGKRLLGYYPVFNHQIQEPKDIPWHLYTDMIFFTAEPNQDLTFTYPNGLGVPEAEKLAKDFVQEAAKHNVSVTLCMGGYTGSRFFSHLSQSDKSRESFAQAMVTYAKRLGFGGLDLDWEYPSALGIGCNTHDQDDTVKFGKLVKEIRKLWPEAKITAAISINGLIGRATGPATPAETVDLVANLDYVDLMAYDVYGNWATTTGPCAPISNKCSDPSLNQSVETGLAVLQAQGFKPEKTMLGIPAYARSYQLTSSQLVPKTVNGTTTYYYQNHTATPPPGGATDDKPGKDVCGNAQNWGGIWLVKELVAKGWLSADEKTGGKGYTRYFDECSGQPFLTNKQIFFSYDDTESTTAKAQLAQRRNLAGVYFYDVLGPLDETVQAAREAIGLSS